MLNSSQSYKDKVYAPVRQFDSRVTITLLGSTKTYDDNKVIRMNILEEMSTLNDTLPSNELQLTMDNNDGDFDLLNFQNMHQIIASKQKIVTEVGLVLVDSEAAKFISDFNGKVSGSMVENGHSVKIYSGDSLVPPSNFSAEVSTSHYGWISSKEGLLSSTGITVSGYMRQVLFSFDIIRILTDRYGEGVWQGKTSISDKVALAKGYIQSMRTKWYGYGSSPVGNKVSSSYWNNGVLSASVVSHTNGTVTELARNNSPSHIQSDGLFHIVVWAEPSDGVTQSVVRTDYIEIEINVNPIYVAEWVKMGTYYLSDWKNEITNKTVAMTANDYFNMFDDISYDPTETTNLKTLATEVLTKGGVPSVDQIIDDSLASITVNAFKERIDCRTALQYISIAACSAAYQDRNGKVVIKPFLAIDAASNYHAYASTQNSLYHYPGGGMYALNNTEGGMKYIDFDNMYDMPEVTLDKSIYQLVVKVYDTAGNATERIYTNTSIAGTNGQSFTIDNPLINSNTLADKVAEWYIRESNYNAIYKSNWRQNPILECADMILVEDSFGAEKQTRIYKQEFTYEGYLTGITESRGGI